ncbi:MAG TPA: hypothetical protein VE911_04430 [Candidatus Nitrosopolaris sp.]|nr:hypothetical protein [Candidatus Nitrosopolaris sp.]
MRALVLALALAGCAARHAAPTLTAPAPETGRVLVVATGAPRVGSAQPIAVAITNGTDEALRVDPRQVYTTSGTGDRIAPLPPAEAARRAGGRHLPGAVRGGAIGAASGGVLGAIGGAIVGAIQGGIGLAVAAGSAAGATIGAISGVIGGSRRPAVDVAGFEAQALPAMTLEKGFSAAGYVYYPAGTYRTLEVLLAETSGAARREQVAIGEAP